LSKEEIIKELLRVIEESQKVEGMPFSTAKELLSLIRMLQIV